MNEIKISQPKNILLNKICHRNFKSQMMQMNVLNLSIRLFV